VSDPLLFGRHVVDLNATNNVPLRSYVWGLDLSETLEGAGGVGGLLWVTVHIASGAAAGTHFCAYDGNGNVVALVSASDGSSTARYEYGPFGEAIRVSGPAANQNPFRFSTKRTCNTTDLVLYEYRAYNPIFGRWLSRDPIEEVGFAFITLGWQPGGAQDFDKNEEPKTGFPHQETEHLYGFVMNTSVNHVDLLGLISFNQCFEDQIMQLRQAWTDMCSLLKDPKFRCCVGRSQLLQMFERRCSWGNVTFKCRRNDQGLCPWACAHAWQSLGIGMGVIVVCDRQFYNPTECPLPLKCLLAHEMTHILAGTPFERGVVEKVEKCCLKN
jgi:RHS repeat-associated protein